MNKILLEVKKIMLESVKEYLPDINIEDLEGKGDIYYMNGRNGAEFDWYVNDKISNFMMFYDDEDKMGAVKATLYNDGGLSIYVYGNSGKEMVKEINTFLDVPDEEILSLAVLLKEEGEGKDKWDDSIENIDTDSEPDKATIEKFISHKSYYEEMRMRADMMGQVAYASKKLFEEGWKVGYMSRDEAVRERDSGWAFMVGNEDNDYCEDANNIMLVSINEMVQYDSAIWKYITMPVGTGLIRVSSDEFEVDNCDKEIYLEKIENE